MARRARIPATFSLASGEERVLDLHPAVRSTYTVTLRTDSEDTRRGLQLTATNAAGDVFQLAALPAPDRGSYRVSLPSGTYQLRALVTQPDLMLEGASRVSVAGHDVAEVQMHLAPVASLAIEVSLDPTAPLTQYGITTQQVTPQMLGLYLRAASEQVEGQSSDLQPMPGGDGVFHFLVPSSRYRLEQSPTFLRVLSATYGGSNAMTDEIAVAPGAAGATLRITASSANATASGTILPAPSRRRSRAAFPQAGFM